MMQTALTKPHAGDRQHVPTDQAAPERATITIWAKPSRNEIIQWANSALRNSEIEYIDEALIEDFADGLSALSADLAAPSAPAEVEGLTDAQKIELMADLNWKPASAYWKEQHDAKAAALTAQQADNERLRGKLEEIGELKAKEFEVLDSPWKARAEKAEGERDAAEEREFNRGYLIACCNLTNLHDMPEVGFDVLRELGLRKAQVDGFGLSEYDAEALRNIEKGRGGSVYADNAIAKLKGDV